MNEKFFALPEEKRQSIINAGYRVFAQNSYKKSPVGEIAAEAGISKSLLFHYFKNKRELYLFLWEYCAQTTIEYLTRYDCYGPNDLFEMMYRGMKAKIALMRQYPDMGRFVIRAFYEKDPEVRDAVHESYMKFIEYKANNSLLRLDPEQFVPGIDLEMMYREMYRSCEGYLWENVQAEEIDIDKMEKDFLEMMDFWKKIYLRKEQTDESH